MVAGPGWEDMHPSAWPGAGYEPPASTRPALPERCGLCRYGPVESVVSPPIGSVNTAHPLRVCNECSGRLHDALSDLPWLRRYVLSRYVPPAPGAPRWERLNR